MKYLNRRWVQISLAVLATAALAWYLLHKTAAGKKMAAKAAAGTPGATTTPAPSATTAPAPATTASPAAALAGNVRYN